MARPGLVEGKVALVTGAGSGIGRATTVVMAREGAAAVAIVDINEGPAHDSAAMVRELGVEALAMQGDVGRRQDVDGFVGAVIDRYGQLDCAVNNAGVGNPHIRLADHTDEEWDAVVRVNLDGVFYCMRAEIKTMLEHGGGAIVNISSGVVVQAQPGLTPYGATKHGVVGLTRGAASEYAADGIRINAIQPGGILTPMMEAVFTPQELVERRARAPMKRLGEPRELAQAVVWLCSDEASWVHGIELRVDGGRHAFSTDSPPYAR